MLPTEQAAAFEKLVNDKLNICCPEKVMKLSSQDKPFMNAELKTIHRRRNREYIKRGKSRKYEELAKQFEVKYKAEASKYLKKNVDALGDANQAKLTMLGAQPGDCIDSNTSVLPNNESEGLSE